MYVICMVFLEGKIHIKVGVQNRGWDERRTVEARKAKRKTEGRRVEVKWGDEGSWQLIEWGGQTWRNTELCVPENLKPRQPAWGGSHTHTWKNTLHPLSQCSLISFSGSFPTMEAGDSTEGVTLNPSDAKPTRAAWATHLPNRSDCWPRMLWQGRQRERHSIISSLCISDLFALKMTMRPQ